MVDNGPGFDTHAPLPNDGRAHIGIENVRDRLLRVCKGELKIESVPGKGTTATITILKKRGA